MTGINYSIIIPHKNIPHLLHRCLSTIPRRDDIQIIIVDDNSDYRLVDFLEFPGKGEKCVEVFFTKENKGAGFARNLGLEHAKGRWLIFIDADDFLVNGWIDYLDKYIETAYDVIYFKIADEGSLSLLSTDYHQALDYRRALDHNYLLNKTHQEIKLNHIVPWGKMIRASVVHENNIKFDEIVCSNDVMFSIKLAFASDSVAISDNYFYCVTRPESHNLTSKKDFNNIILRLDVLLNRNDYVKKHGFPDMLIPPLIFIWQNKHLGLISVLKMCYKVINSSTPLFYKFFYLTRKFFG